MMTLLFLSPAGAAPDLIAGLSRHPKGAGA